MHSENTKNATISLPLTSPEAAEYLGLSESTMRKLRVSGRGPAFIKSSDTARGRVRYLRTTLDAWLETRARKSTSEYAAA